MNASGATSMTPFSIISATFSASNIDCSASKSGRR
jgi:hypothetical protein